MSKTDSHAANLRMDTQSAPRGGGPPVLAVLGGDLRTESLVRELSGALSPKNAILRLFACPMAGERTLEAALSAASAVILPIPLSRDGVSLNAPYGGEGKLSLREGLLPALLRCAPGASLFCGMPTEAFALDAEKAGFPLFDYGKDEEFLLAGASLTAEGMLPLLEAHLGAPLREKVPAAAVAGYGRVGSAAADALAARGVKVTVLCRSEKAAEEAQKKGHKALSFRTLYQFGGSALSGFPLLCNTIPAQVFQGPLLASFEGLYLELASLPGGLTKEALDGRRSDPARYLALPGVPGKVLPDKAGRAAAAAVLRAMAAANGVERDEGKGASEC